MAWNLLRRCAPGLLAALAALAAGEGQTPAVETAETLLVAGFENRLEEPEDWQDLRLGMGLRGRLAEVLAATGRFEVQEEKELAASVAQAASGLWLRETEEAGGLSPFVEMQGQRAIRWLAYGSLDVMAVTRDRVTGVVGGRRWAYRAVVTLCLRSAGGRELCREGRGRSTTRVAGAVVEYRGEALAFDQQGPAQALDRALVAAFNELMPAWETER